MSEQKIALITGATKGIGRAIAGKLKSFNIFTIEIGRSNGIDISQFVSENIDRDGLKIRADIRNEDEVKYLVETCFRHFGRIDYFINNAGVGTFKKLEEFSTEEYDAIMDTNVKAMFLFLKYLLPHFKKQKAGHIVAVTSDVARRTFESGSIYCASKYAQDAMLSALRREVHDYGIKLSTVMPGMTATEFADTDPEAEYKKEWLKAADVADAVLYILNSPPHVILDEIILHPMMQKY